MFGATVDTGWWATQGYDASLAIEELATDVLHVHLKDVRAVAEPHETCRWGDGIVTSRRACGADSGRLRGRDRGRARARDHDPSDESARCETQFEQWLA